jgi:hypothetical protein
MSYAIGNIGYGFLLPYNILEAINNTTLIEVIENAEGVHKYYSANGLTPIFIGVEVGKLDECNDVDIVNDILHKFTLSTFAYNSNANRIKQRVIDFVKDDIEYETNAVFKEFVNVLEKCEPRKIIIWSNS